ncbi:MAG: hypothetical protein P9M10_04805, partial [Candidatus Euphemobacter frigidus]|nr:hypothetical protein [Candidatus Euphemobacter frigidus]
MNSGFKNAASLITAMIVMAGLVSACSFLPEREEPAAPEIPEQFSVEGGEDDLSINWWEDFGSAELNRLVEEAFAGSFNLRQAEARLRQARATAVIAGGNLYPE